jgi:hypothetical protein
LKKIKMEREVEIGLLAPLYFDPNPSLAPLIEPPRFRKG